MASNGIHHVALTVSDWNRSAEFYSQLFESLGATELLSVQGPPHKDPDGHVRIYGGGSLMVTLWEASPEYRRNGEHVQLYNVGLHHVAFSADSRDDVDSLYQKLVEMRADVIDPPSEYGYAPGYYAVYFRDPDGIKLEYVHVPD